ncbi:molybdopterin converting factor subunit 1 [Martelella lutilitoris]|uniref:Molybdopterin converting factor subunit 1 n=1 Tax=Martelella lutilitoris TaxID=2583532 RepID=A0A5C4JNL6_9HYPH|nr:molybdopterin converting factor subunit 1 [Martelella lutilitoris]TNB46938.1 molybdopterin converting factor subunit 1 [Martelella lutilitoris]
MTKLIYFAWVRERIGLAEEDIDLPEDVTDVGGLLSFLQGRGEGYELALQEPEVIRVALDRVHAEHDAPLEGAREIALFPPMTGG